MSFTYAALPKHRYGELRQVNYNRKLNVYSKLVCDQRHSTCLEQLQGTWVEQVKFWMLELESSTSEGGGELLVKNKTDFSQTVG